MSITKYRHMNYTDDGCDLYQCLNCYKTLEIRYIPDWKFCPMCGIEYSEELKCRTTNDPSWLYKLGLDFNKAYDLAAKGWEKSKAGWMLKKRVVWWDIQDGVTTFTYDDHPGTQKWHTYWKDDGYNKHNAVSMLKMVKDFREDEDYRPKLQERGLSFGTFSEYKVTYGEF
jgi:hypothetical protein